MCASVSDVIMVGRRETGNYRPYARVAIHHIGINHVHNGPRFPVPRDLEALLRDTEALQRELRATGLPCYDEYFERIKTELVRVIGAKQCE